MKKPLLCIPAIFLYIISLSAFYQNSDSELILLNDTVPELNFTTIAGNKYNTVDFRGKVVVIDFWYIHCVPCVALLPELLKLEHKYRDEGVIFLSLSLDTADETQKLLNRKGIVLDAIPNTQRIHELFDLKVYPSMLIIDKNGIVRKRVMDGVADYLDELIQEMLLLN